MTDIQYLLWTLKGHLHAHAVWFLSASSLSWVSSVSQPISVSIKLSLGTEVVPLPLSQHHGQPAWCLLSCMNFKGLFVPGAAHTGTNSRACWLLIQALILWHMTVAV